MWFNFLRVPNAWGPSEPKIPLSELSAPQMVWFAGKRHFLSDRNHLDTLATAELSNVAVVVSGNGEMNWVRQSTPHGQYPAESSLGEASVNESRKQVSPADFGGHVLLLDLKRVRVGAVGALPREMQKDATITFISLDPYGYHLIFGLSNSTTWYLNVAPLTLSGPSARMGPPRLVHQGRGRDLTCLAWTVFTEGGGGAPQVQPASMTCVGGTTAGQVVEVNVEYPNQQLQQSPWGRFSPAMTAAKPPGKWQSESSEATSSSAATGQLDAEQAAILTLTLATAKPSVTMRISWEFPSPPDSSSQNLTKTSSESTFRSLPGGFSLPDFSNTRLTDAAFFRRMTGPTSVGGGRPIADVALLSAGGQRICVAVTDGKSVWLFTGPSPHAAMARTPILLLEKCPSISRLRFAILDQTSPLYKHTLQSQREGKASTGEMPPIAAGGILESWARQVQEVVSSEMLPAFSRVGFSGIVSPATSDLEGPASSGGGIPRGDVTLFVLMSATCRLLVIPIDVTSSSPPPGAVEMQLPYSCDSVELANRCSRTAGGVAESLSLPLGLSYVGGLHTATLETLRAVVPCPPELGAPLLPAATPNLPALNCGHFLLWNNCLVLQYAEVIFVVSLVNFCVVDIHRRGMGFSDVVSQVLSLNDGRFWIVGRSKPSTVFEFSLRPELSRTWIRWMESAVPERALKDAPTPTTKTLIYWLWANSLSADGRWKQAVETIHAMFAFCMNSPAAGQEGPTAGSLPVEPPREGTDEAAHLIPPFTFEDAVVSLMTANQSIHLPLLLSLHIELLQRVRKSNERIGEKEKILFFWLFDTLLEQNRAVDEAFVGTVRAYISSQSPFVLPKSDIIKLVASAQEHKNQPALVWIAVNNGFVTKEVVETCLKLGWIEQILDLLVQLVLRCKNGQVVEVPRVMSSVIEQIRLYGSHLFSYNPENFYDLCLIPILWRRLCERPSDAVELVSTAQYESPLHLSVACRFLESLGPALMDPSPSPPLPTGFMQETAFPEQGKAQFLLGDLPLLSPSTKKPHAGLTLTWQMLLLTVMRKHQRRGREPSNGSEQTDSEIGLVIETSSDTKKHSEIDAGEVDSMEEEILGLINRWISSTQLENGYMVDLESLMLFAMRTFSSSALLVRSLCYVLVQMDRTIIAVDKALTAGNIPLAKWCVSNVKNEDVQRQQWLKIVKHVIDRGGSSETIGDHLLDIIRSSADTNLCRFPLANVAPENKDATTRRPLPVHSILPLLTNADLFALVQNELASELQLYEAQIQEEEKKIVDQHAVIEEHIKEIEGLQERYVDISTDQPCEFCRRVLFHTYTRTVTESDRLYIFPCGHGFHYPCAMRIRRQFLDSKSQSEVAALIEQEKRLAPHTLTSKEISAELRDVESALDNILADECPLCGSFSVEAVLVPFTRTREDPRWDVTL